MTKKIFFRIAAICAVFNIAAVQDVNAYSINLSVERKEICVNDIPADRKVSLGISMYNNPVTDQLGITIIKDPALSFANVLPISNLDPVFGTNFSYTTTPGNNNTTAMNFWCVSGNYSGNNTLGYIDLLLPEGAAAGNFYPVDLVGDKGLYLYYTNESGNRDYLVADSFNLTNGGVQINQAPQPDPPAPVPAAPAPIPEPQVPVPAPEPAPVQQQPNNPGGDASSQTAHPVSNGKSPETTVISLNTSDSSVSSVSSSPSEKNKSKKSSESSSPENSSDAAGVSDTQMQKPDPENSSVSKTTDANTKNKSGTAPFFIAAAVIVAAAAAVIIIKVKGKKE